MSQRVFRSPYPDTDHPRYLVNFSQGYPEIAANSQIDHSMSEADHSPTFKMSMSAKSLCYLNDLILYDMSISPYFCANHAPVTMLNFSRRCPKDCGLPAMTTTAFCTVLRVTSAGRFCNWSAAICRVQDIPKTEVALPLPAAFRRSVK